ncbi:EAL and HDOD domain-containing protein [Noviherbaspirillum massiliense]|uniref:EAL and HDOD domain-containing protein n=1 Tax=Noviherbaspirillum massiliense TaxID=1465823 RepID=UPI0003054FC6|nr:HDOD domain-containing protein [Noviherbaspirillum massiliense]
MQDLGFIVREPLLNPEERVLGYEVKWQHTGSAAPSEADVEQLLNCVAEHLTVGPSGTLLGDQVLFLEVLPQLLMSDAVAALPAQGTVLALRAPDVDADALEAIRELRGRGYGISLRGGDLASIDKAILASVTHFEIGASATDFSAQVEHHRALGLSSLRLAARQAGNWQEFDACAGRGIDAFVGQLHLSPRQGTVSKGLNPAQTMILQLMDLVRKNADIRQLESIFKRDAALSYKLLRYINSAGFGLGCEIQSLKHAVSLLGYSPLYRWLSLLLASASTTGYSPVLLQNAVIRGRFSELLGREFLPKTEADNLFVAGMFSLLDRLLGVPMEDVLEKIQLPEEVTHALLAREGIYGPFLALAEACELNSPEVEAMATSLCIGTGQVNQAHLAALAWVQSIKL